MSRVRLTWMESLRVKPTARLSSISASHTLTVALRKVAANFKQKWQKKESTKRVYDVTDSTGGQTVSLWGSLAVLKIENLEQIRETTAVNFTEAESSYKARPICFPTGPATGHLDTGFSWFPCVYKQMLRWFPRFQVATTCFSCSPPDLNLLVTKFIFCIHVK